MDVLVTVHMRRSEAEVVEPAQLGIELTGHVVWVDLPTKRPPEKFAAQEEPAIAID